MQVAFVEDTTIGNNQFLKLKHGYLIHTLSDKAFMCTVRKKVHFFIQVLNYSKTWYNVYSMWVNCEFFDKWKFYFQVFVVSIEFVWLMMIDWWINVDYVWVCQFRCMYRSGKTVKYKIGKKVEKNST